MLSFSGKLSIASNIVSLAAVGLAWHGIPASAPLSYPAHKMLHVLGVIIFMGNLVAGPLWIWFATFEDKGRHYAFAARTIAAADIWLTTPGVQLAVWNGLFLAATLGGVRHNRWLVEAVLWLVVSSIISVVVVLPLQEQMVDAAQGDDPKKARSALIRWSVMGTIVMIPFSVVGWLMVSKTPLLLH